MPRLASIAALCLLLPAVAGHAAPTDEIVVAGAKTSLFLNSLTLGPLPLKRTGARYEAAYAVKVFPVFFLGENGRFALDLPDAELARLIKGGTVTFTGEAENTDHEKRRVIGTATPTDADSGKIRVKIFVSAKLALTFDTTYRLAGK